MEPEVPYPRRATCNTTQRAKGTRTEICWETKQLHALDSTCQRVVQTVCFLHVEVPITMFHHHH